MQIWFFGLPGSGKTHLARLFSQMTCIPQYEGDDFHTENDRKIIAEGAFTLAHRHAQLERISAALQLSSATDAIITHPLPDHESRRLVRAHPALLVYVKAPIPLVRERLAARKEHHFSAELLDAWIPRHWQEPADEDFSIINNNMNGRAIEHQLKKLRDTLHL